MRAVIIAVVAAWLASPAVADRSPALAPDVLAPPDLSPFGYGRGFRPGANHHLGDDGFIAKYGHAPTWREEKERIHEHFAMIRDRLAARPATRPDLAAKRAKILSYFDDYMRKGLTPQNTHLPWRSPVFIDDHGTICAVGYLIEQTAGRDLAESVAKTHRYDFLEDIAAAMPEVRAWVDASGLTLEELSSIQPAYSGSWLEQFVAWSQRDFKNGEYDREGAKGRFRHHRMDGPWTVGGETAIGTGQLHGGSGAWRSFYDDGKLMAEGRYVANYPSGTWKLYFPSGNVAARGALTKGIRDGKWTFYYDTPAHTPIAIGQFSGGARTGTWRHFDDTGALLAESRPARSGMLMTVVPGADRVEHQVVSFANRLERYALAGDNLYIQGDDIFDATGHKIAKALDGHWTSAPCGWSDARVRAAKRGDIVRLADLITRNDDNDDGLCGLADDVPADRGAKLDAILAPLQRIRAQNPTFVRDIVLRDQRDPWDRDPEAEDLAKVVARHLSYYSEWPYVDQRFRELYPTLPGLSNPY